MLQNVNTRVLCMDTKMNSSPLWLNVLALMAMIIVVVFVVVIALGGCLC